MNNAVPGFLEEVVLRATRHLKDSEGEMTLKNLNQNFPSGESSQPKRITISISD